MERYRGHWKIGKIKHIATFVNEKSTPETDAIKISPENVESQTGKVLDFYSPYDSAGVKFQAGDVLFNKLRVYLSKVVFAEYGGYSIGEMIVIRPSLQNTGKYLFYLMLSCRFIEYCNSISDGVKMPRTDINDILNARIPITSHQEQAQIISFLDRKTSEIDRFIANEEKLISQLNEQKIAIINRAVTKGLDPNAQMEPSGVEEIGKIPKAWCLTKLKYAAQIDNSGLWGEEQGMLDIDAPVSTTAHLTRDGNWLIEQMPIRSFSKADYEYYSGKNGDIIIVKSSGSATNIITGKAGFIENYSKGIVFSNFLMRVKPNREKCESKLLYYFLTSSITKERIKRMVSATTYPNLKVEEYISNLIPIPSSKNEQMKIVNFLDRETKQIDELISKERQKIELIKKYRQALISQAVTGKIDVREMT